MEAQPLKKPTPSPPPPEGGEEDLHYIMLKDIKVPMGHQFISLNRGDVLDDPHLIDAIKRAFAVGRLPMRKISLQDLLDKGLL